MNDVMEIIYILDPNISLTYTGDQIKIFLDIARATVNNIEIDDSKKNLAIALTLLDLLSTPDSSSISRTKIGDVEISYSGKGITKWKKMFESLLNGTNDSDLDLLYRGI